MNGMTLFKKLLEDKWGKQASVIFLTNIGNSKEIIEALEFDKCNQEKAFNRDCASKTTRKSIRSYLKGRFKNSGSDFFIKFDCKIDDIIKKATLLTAT